MNTPSLPRKAPFWLRFVSALSGGSLLFFGIGSVMLSLLFWSLAGCLVGLAMAILGSIELWQRHRLIALNEPRAGDFLALNQLALGVVVSIYLGAQLVGFDAASVNAALADMMQQFGGALPAESVDQVQTMLAPAVRIIVLALLGSVWLGCIGMALYYFNYGRSLEEERLLRAGR